MNSSTLRRLAADHASLHTSELPPHYLFPPASSSSIPDDLTQLTILLAGPQGTPYSQGLWKLFLRIPEDYPKSPPKASFRTRIWHPNVEENSGSVCVDTLKRDWQPTLTLRHVLITISCLLIQPNPDSALNATAGHLLQDDYESFARQARLMTSIHASIPSDLQKVVHAAKRRGEDPGCPTISDDPSQRPTIKEKSASSSSVVMKRLPQRLISTQSAPILRQGTEVGSSASSSDSASEDGDENSASKENDPMLSPSPVPAQTPRRPTLAKRPLSDLPTPIEPDEEFTEVSCLTPSDQNVLNSTSSSASGQFCKVPKFEECSQPVNFSGRGLQDASLNGFAALPVEDKAREDSTRSAKRICSDESKENMSAAQAFELPAKAQATASFVSKAPASAPASRIASAAGSLGAGSVKGKARMGLRRL